MFGSVQPAGVLPSESGLADEDDHLVHHSACLLAAMSLCHRSLDSLQRRSSRSAVASPTDRSLHHRRESSIRSIAEQLPGLRWLSLRRRSVRLFSDSGLSASAGVFPHHPSGNAGTQRSLLDALSAFALLEQRLSAGQQHSSSNDQSRCQRREQIRRVLPVHALPLGSPGPSGDRLRPDLVVHRLAPHALWLRRSASSHSLAIGLRPSIQSTSKEHDALRGQTRPGSERAGQRLSDRQDVQLGETDGGTRGNTSSERTRKYSSSQSITSGEHGLVLLFVTVDLPGHIRWFVADGSRTASGGDLHGLDLLRTDPRSRDQLSSRGDRTLRRDARSVETHRRVHEIDEPTGPASVSSAEREHRRVDAGRLVRLERGTNVSLAAHSGGEIGNAGGNRRSGGRGQILVALGHSRRNAHAERRSIGLGAVGLRRSIALDLRRFHSSEHSSRAEFRRRTIPTGDSGVLSRCGLGEFRGERRSHGGGRERSERQWRTEGTHRSRPSLVFQGADLSSRRSSRCRRSARRPPDLRSMHWTERLPERQDTAVSHPSDAFPRRIRRSDSLSPRRTSRCRWTSSSRDDLDSPRRRRRRRVSTVARQSLVHGRRS